MPAIDFFLRPEEEASTAMRYVRLVRRRTAALSIQTALAFFTTLFLFVPAFAQNDVGSIVGFVSDSSGAAVPNTKVTINNEGTGESRTVTSDGSGHYAVPNLPPAVYTMSAEATGFQR